MYRENHPDLVERIAASVDKPFMSDDLPHLLYDLAGIESPAYHPERSVLNPNYTLPQRPLLQSPDMITRKSSKNHSFHSGSCRQSPAGKPIAPRSISGNSEKSAVTLSGISLLGEMMLRKYLMMHRLK